MASRAEMCVIFARNLVTRRGIAGSLMNGNAVKRWKRIQPDVGPGPGTLTCGVLVIIFR